MIGFMDKRVQRELSRLRADRELLARELERVDLEIGRQAGAAMLADKYTSKSALGRLLGFSHTHVGTLIERANAAPPPIASERIPVMDNTIAGDYVLSTGARIVRSISGFNPGDVLVQAGLDPRLFAEGGRHVLDLPSMLWQLDSGDWVGVSQATAGYVGTGPDFSRQALIRAGVDQDTAKEIVKWRFCDAVDIEDPESWTTSTVWPVHGRTAPLVIDDRMIVMFGDGLSSLRGYALSSEPERDPIDETGFYASRHPDTSLGAWLRFLSDDEHLPEWAQGPRIARVFRNSAVAAEHGFVVAASRLGGSRGDAQPCVVIEQGMVQLWGFFFRPHDTTQYLPEEAYEVLAAADVYPEHLAARDERAARPWGRFIAGLFNVPDGLPDHIDVSASGSDVLVFTPSESIRY